MESPGRPWSPDRGLSPGSTVPSMPGGKKKLGAAIGSRTVTWDTSVETFEVAISRRSTLEHKKVLGGGGRIIQDTMSESWAPLRLYLADFLESTTYDLLMSFVISLNLGLVVVETDMRAQEGRVEVWMKVCTTFMLLVYVTEMGCRLFVLRCAFYQSKQNVFDFLIVGLDTLLEIMNATVGELPSLSVLRVFRMLRIVRVIRTMMVFRELYLMLMGLVSALRAIFFAIILIGLLLTMWSILAVDFVHPRNMELENEGWYTNCERCPRAFATVMAANITFIKYIIAGDSWSETCVPLIEEYPATSLVLMPALLSVQLGLMNLIIAVIVDKAAETHRNDDELLQTIRKEEFDAVSVRLVSVFSQLDTDESGSMTCKELMEGYDTSPKFAEILTLMDIGRDDLELVFQIMDKDCSGEVTYEEFVEQLYKMKSYDIHTLLMFVKQHVQEMRVDFHKQLRTVHELQKRHENSFSQVLHILERSGADVRLPIAPEHVNGHSVHPGASALFTKESTAFSSIASDTRSAWSARGVQPLVPLAASGTETLRPPQEEPPLRVKNASLGLAQDAELLFKLDALERDVHAELLRSAEHLARVVRQSAHALFPEDSGERRTPSAGASVASPTSKPAVRGGSASLPETKPKFLAGCSGSGPPEPHQAPWASRS